MKKDIILSGVGGQGILSIATVIGKAALKEGLYMKQAEVHGMSQRSIQPPHQRQADCFGSDTIRQMRPYHFAGTDGRSALSSLSQFGRLAGNQRNSVRQHPQLSGRRQSNG